jgi:phage terminase Nu1 subunit (DNA packaging protein)
VKETGTIGDLAEFWDCSTVQVAEYTKLNIAVRLKRGVYDLKASNRNLVRRLREQAAGRAGVDASTDAMAANVKLKEANVRLLEIKIQKQSGELIAIVVAKELWGRLVLGLRQFVLRLPGSIAFEVPSLTATDKATIERICRDDLKDAAMGRGLYFVNRGGGAKADDDEPGKASL